MAQRRYRCIGTQQHKRGGQAHPQTIAGGGGNCKGRAHAEHQFENRVVAPNPPDENIRMAHGRSPLSARMTPAWRRNRSSPSATPSTTAREEIVAPLI